MPTYTNRHLEMQTVVRIERYPSGSVAITGSEGYTAGASSEVADRLTIGAAYGLETKGGPFGTICGWFIDGEWVARKSDEQLAQERDDWLAKYERERAEQLAEHRAEWIGREENLPGWLKERIHVFHERGGEQFELDGWGYELAVCELAALYAESGGQDSPAVTEYAEREGTSGNQHDMAKALARAHREGQTLAGTVAALSPLTGNAFYEPAS